MKKPPLVLFIFLLVVLILQSRLQAQEVWATEQINRTLTPSGQRYWLMHPFEIAYGPDDSLYITEKVGRVIQVSAKDGKRKIILDYRSVVSSGVTYSGGVATNIEQRGMMGLALHKNFKNGTNYIYIAYSNNSSNVRISRFTYSTTTWTLDPASESVLITGIPASSDHSSGRLIYGPDDKLYYSCGDMGNNQFNNRCNEIRAQKLPTTSDISGANYANYSGKILRINLNGTIPTDNPSFDPDGAGPQAAVVSHIFTMGHRNPQGLVFETNTNYGDAFPVLKTSGTFYSSEHGVRTDDEINILSSGNNYGWPYWSGFRDASPDNYHYINWSSSGSCSGTTYNEVTVPPGATIVEENTYAVGAFTEPIFSMYARCNGASNCATTLTTGTDWMKFPTIAPSSIDYYGFTYIPGWNKSLIIPTLRRGTIYRYKLNAAGTAVTGDSIPYFFRTDRYRDIAIKAGNIIFAVTDSTGSTSGPSGGGTSTLSAPGTILKYTFLGYQDNGSGRSTLPTSIGVTAGTISTCNPATQVVIGPSYGNANVWVPITGPDGNIMAEIYANGVNLDTVRSSFYINSGANRSTAGVKYLNRNMTITPKFQPGVGQSVKIRLYISKVEYDALDLDGTSGISGLSDLRILKNNDACGGAVSSNTQTITPSYTPVLHGSGAYVVQYDNLQSFSSFYFGASGISTLPVELLTFKGTLHNNVSELQWQTSQEINTSHFVVERSIDGVNYNSIGSVAANGNSHATLNYNYADNQVANLPATVVYYRLKIVDKDGQFAYSKVVTVSLTYIVGHVVVAPNPVSGEAKVSIVAATNGKLQWRLIDNTGRVVYQGVENLNAGNNQINIDMHRLSGGIYYLNLTTDGIDKKVKIQKL